MTDKKIVRIYVTLFDEGTPTIRGTDAIDLGDGTFKLLPTSNYDPEDETWEFLPGSIVATELIETDDHEKVLLAIKAI